MRKKVQKKNTKQATKLRQKRSIRLSGITKTIGFKLRVIPLVCVLIAICSTGLISIFQSRNEMINLVKDNAETQATYIKDILQSNNEFNSYMNQQMKEKIKTAATQVIGYDGTVSNQQLATMAANLNIQEVNIIDLSGTVLYSNQEGNVGYVHPKDSKIWKVINGETDFLVEDIKQSSKGYYQYGYITNGRKVVQVGVLANDYQKALEKTDIQYVISSVAENNGLVYVEYVDTAMNICGHSNEGLVNTTSSSETIRQVIGSGEELARSTNYRNQQVYEVTVPVKTDIGTDAVQVASSLNEVNKVVRDMMLNMLILMAITFVIISVLMYMVASGVIKPLNKLSEAAGDVAAGDLTKEIKVKAYSGDVIGKLAESFIAMSDSLKNSIKAIQGNSSESSSMAENLNTNAKQMAMTATEVTNAIQEVAKGAEQQASDLVQVSENVSRLSDELDKIHNKVSGVKESNSFTEGKASVGEAQINSLLESIESLKGALLKQAESIRSLNIRIKEVNNITNVISDISNQTNLLALNAAIEAARAGEAGKGFAVVSEQVRKLADQTKNATEDAKKVISTIINGANDVLNTSNSITKMVDQQSDTAANTGSAFNEMLNALEKVGPMIEETYESIQRTIKAKDDIVSSVESITAVAEEISASSEEISASSEEMLASTEEVAESAGSMENIAKSLQNETNKFTI